MDARKRNSYVILASATAAFFFILINQNKTSTQQRLYNEITAGNIEKVRDIISKHYNLLEKKNEQNGRTALAIAAASGQRAIAELLITEGADINVESDIGWTPLHYAVRMNYPDTVSLLITKGANVNAPGHGNAPIHLAAFYGYKDILIMLIDAGADINAKGAEGWTALFFACCSGKSDIVSLLIDKGASIDIMDDNNRSPIDVALKKKHNDLAKQLRKIISDELLLK